MIGTIAAYWLTRTSDDVSLSETAEVDMVSYFDFFVALFVFFAVIVFIRWLWGLIEWR
jgi:small-conductance mechanosensitive channel